LQSFGGFTIAEIANASPASSGQAKRIGGDADEHFLGLAEFRDRPRRLSHLHGHLPEGWIDFENWNLALAYSIA
jgi:hypothetical protein